LSQSGTLMSFGNTLVAGLTGRLTGFDPTTGRILWDAPMATPRGVNDLERLVDIVGLTHRSDPYLCARAYLSQVACINASRGQVAWARPSQGEQGLSGLGSVVVGTESNGLVVAWQRDSGDRLWESDRLKYRHLSAPVVFARSKKWAAHPSKLTRWQCLGLSSFEPPRRGSVGHPQRIGARDAQRLMH
jgi:outer membrane protein assembly factor BamB